MHYDVIIAGAGMAGLTAAAYLSSEGYAVLLCEKEAHAGGLVGSYVRNGFTFDYGIRALENSGVLLPMLRQLGIEVDFVPSPVSVGIGEDIIDIKDRSSLLDYREHLRRQFPEEGRAVDSLIRIIREVMKHMEVLYGIDNPLFMNPAADPAYLFGTLLPWLFRFPLTIGKINRMDRSAESLIADLSDNPVFVDMIVQHFFKETPAFFALSYFSLYLDYLYPRGGVGSLTDALVRHIRAKGGEVRFNTEITAVHPAKHRIETGRGDSLEYRRLIWCADQKQLYTRLHDSELPDGDRGRISGHRSLIKDKRGNDSVLTLFTESALEPDYFRERHNPHFFYTPYREGISRNPLGRIRSADGRFSNDRTAVFNWVREYLRLTTYEISVPSLRDSTLSPPGKTGVIISTLMDYSLVRHISDSGWYEDFKDLCKDAVPRVLDDTVYPGFRNSVIAGDIATPLTVERIAGTTDGAIVGWAYTGGDVPAVDRMIRVSKSVLTPIPHVLQAGQWTYSPAGMPIAVMTGKLAADRIMKELDLQTEH